MIVFKYYKLGSLFSLLFQRDKNPSLSEKYNLNLAIGFAVRISTSLNVMHSKGYLHNDLKPDNILLDSDQEEDLFPVLCDFGSIQVLDSAKIIPGFKVMKSQSATPEYCAPEVLAGYKNNERICTIKTDIYSCGIVILELFTRRRAWNKFTIDFVINGGLPDLSLKRFMDNLDGVGKEIVLKIIKIVLQCVDLDPSIRPSMESVIQTLENLSKR
jgi:serine/threonine protein kinase